MRVLDEGIRIRADEKTVRLIDRAADLMNMKRSAFVREAALREARRIIQTTPAANAGVGTAAYPPTGNGGAQAKNLTSLEKNGIAPQVADRLCPSQTFGGRGAARSR